LYLLRRGKSLIPLGIIPYTEATHQAIFYFCISFWFLDMFSVHQK
jgi:hypothetical protein